MIKVAFVLLTLLMAILFTAAMRYAVNESLGRDGARSFAVKMIIALALWFAYVAAVSTTGILNSTTLPPRVPLLLILPLFAFTAYFFAGSRFKSIIAAMPAGWLVYAQSFRILVELLLLALSLHKIVPVSATIEGYNYEMVFGFSSLLVGYFGFTKKVISPVVILLWNIVGLISLGVIVYIFMSHIYNPSMWQDGENFSLHDFASFPYTLLAGFLMPLAVFLHVFSIVKTRKSLNTRSA